MAPRSEHSRNGGGQRGRAKDQGRGGGRNKKRDMGRGEWARNREDRRPRNDDEQASKRRRTEDGEGEKALPIYATQFTEEEIAAEGRRPKKKVAVMIGYSGSGYKGMQMTHDQKTIEGDLFQAFVAAGAISKANATDPKKSAFVRCARTDKGVHAAGNIISLKLIMEDKDLVEKINQNLSSQIRVWGIERTNQSFNAYQLCDSRIYEYLIPTYAFLPPHFSSFLGKTIVQFAEAADDTENYLKRQQEVSMFWNEVEEQYIKPILETYDPETRGTLEAALYTPEKASKVQKEAAEEGAPANDKAEKPDRPYVDNGLPPASVDLGKGYPETDLKEQNEQGRPEPSPVVKGTRALRQAYLTAKRAYRISPDRLKRVTEAFEMYKGTHAFHNYTVDKSHSDPSAQRIIKSFIVNQEPIIIDGTEWLSLKVHGQSFMMHQIRKMVGMVALTVRCGCDPHRIVESYSKERISIPKAPGLGLLLERPVFDNYNKRAGPDFGWQPLDFDKYQKEIQDFKQHEIYERIYREEANDNVFSNFFNHIDNFHESTFLFLTSKGIGAVLQSAQDVLKTGTAAIEAVDSDSDDAADGQGAEG